LSNRAAERTLVRKDASNDGLSSGLVFVLNVIRKNCRPDVFKETVVQTLAAIQQFKKE
jgi:hypothetical protein